MSLKKIFEHFLNFLLPPNETVSRLESMSAEEFRESAPLASLNLPANTLALFDYKNPLVKQAIFEVKYRGNRKIGGLLAECLYEELVSEFSDRSVFENFNRPLLIPIPLSKKRLRERGFNQCELLCKALVREDSKNGNQLFEYNPDILLKIRDTESQTKKNRAERLLNLSGCFAVASPEKIADRNILLLDDVVTTGATMEEAKKTLTVNGARKIISVAVGH